jgi:hypothetical protein
MSDIYAIIVNPTTKKPGPNHASAKSMAGITKGVIFAIGGHASNQFYRHFPDAARTQDAGNETFHNAQSEVKSVRAGSARKFVKFFTN